MLEQIVARPTCQHLSFTDTINPQLCPFNHCEILAWSLLDWVGPRCTVIQSNNHCSITRSFYWSRPSVEVWHCLKGLDLKEICSATIKKRCWLGPSMQCQVDGEEFKWWRRIQEGARFARDITQPEMLLNRSCCQTSSLSRWFPFVNPAACSWHCSTKIHVHHPLLAFLTSSF